MTPTATQEAPTADSPTRGRQTRASRPSRREPAPVEYPTGDGKPMAETDKHVSLILDTRSELQLHFEPRADSVYVSGNNFLYYEEGNPKAKVSPDGYVVFGVPQRERDSYKTWEEGDRTPAIVFEFTSRKTRVEDLTTKRHLYEQILKVPEYILFDPTAAHILSRLRGLRLVDGAYVEIEIVNGRLYSEQLGLYLVPDGFKLRFFDPIQNRFIPTLFESEAQRKEAATKQRDAEGRQREAEAKQREAEARQREAEATTERQQREIEELRRLLAAQEG